MKLKFLDKTQEYYWQQAKLAYYRSKILIKSNRVELNPNLSWDYYKLGSTLIEQRQWQQATQVLTRGIELDPSNPDLHLKLGSTLIEQRQRQQAAQVLTRGIELDPSNSYLHQLLGYTLVEQKQWQQAAQVLTYGIELDPSNSYLYQLLGYTLVEQKQWQQAAQILSRGIELNPSNSYLYDLLTEALEQLKDIRKNPDKIKEMIAIYSNLMEKMILATHPHFKFYFSNNINHKQPSFIIIGQRKCGTTFLYHYLCQHPQIIPALKKETHFWSRNYELGFEWYRAHFAAISPEQNFITGEASPSYINNQNTLERIARFFPQIKLIVLLRNPVKRTLSDYYMFRQILGEKRSLNEAVFDQIELDVSLKSKYIEDSKYFNRLHPWLEVFPKEQFLILKSEDMFANTQRVMDRVFDFLEVEPCQMNQYKKINSASYPDISPSQRKLLQDYFRPYNQELEAYLDREFNWYD